MEIEEAKRRAKAGPAILLARRGAAILVSFVSTFALARLVSPREFGLAGMSAVVLAFAEIFRDFGLTNAVLRKGHVSQSELSMIFWFNAVMTLALAILIIVLAPFAAVFYKEPVVQWVMMLSALGFISTGLTLQHRAIVDRDLRFSEMAITDTACSVIGLVVTVALALMWHNVWALVWGVVFQSFASSIAYVRLSHWKPSRFSRGEEFKSLLIFGANSSVYSISIFISQNISAILIGHFVGSASLGQYTRAQTLLNIPSQNLVQPITQVAMPLMARLRSNPHEYRIAYLSMTRKLSVFLVPMAIGLSFASVPLVQALLGDRWEPAGEILTALFPVLAPLGLLYSVGDLFVTQDRSAELRNLGLWEMIIRVSGVGIGLIWGPVGAAIGFTAATTIVGMIRVFVAGRTGPVTTRDQFEQILPAIPLGAGALIGSLGAMVLVGEASHAMQAAAILMAAGILALAAGLPFARSRAALFEVAEVFGLDRVLRMKSRGS